LTDILLKSPDLRWSKFGTSIFSTMTMAAMRANAVNLAQGFPDFDGPEFIKKAAIEAIKGNQFNQYAPSHGIAPLRSILSKHMERKSGALYNFDSDITVFSGATEALFCSFLAFLAPKDEVITFSPYFDCYPAGVFAAQAKLVEVPLNPKNWTFSKESLELAVSPKTKMILINTPHNPTGRVFSKTELQIIADIAIKNNLLVVTDEVYDELVYDNKEFPQIHQLPGMRDRTIVISSTAKTFSFTGWKIGYAFAPEALTRELRAVHQFTVFCSATPLQYAMSKALEADAAYFTNLRSEYSERRDFLYEELSKIGFKIIKPEGTYFLVADYSDLSDLDDLNFARWLTESKKVATIPTSVFYNNPEEIRKTQRHVRFAYCKNIDTLKKGVENLKSL